MPLWLTNLILVAFAGAVGSVCRWAIVAGVDLSLRTAWPWGTLVVNVLGCLIFGAGFALGRGAETPMWLRLVVLTGFAGAFTTFSTLVFELHYLHQRFGPGWAAAHLSLHVGLGLAALLLGVALVAWHHGPANP